MLCPGLRSTLAAGLLVLAAGACTDDTLPTVPGNGAAPVTTAAAVGYDTCEVVPVGMVNRNLGLDLPDGHRANGTDARTCEYGSYSFAGPPGNVLVTVVVAATSNEAQSTFAGIVSNHSGRPVSGVGDEAAVAPFSSQFVARQGNVVVNVYAVSGEARLGSTDAELQALALEILGASATLPGAATTPAAVP